MSENENNKNEEQEIDVNHLIQIRRDKLKELQENGKNPFEITKYNRTHTAGEVKANYDALENTDVTVTLHQDSYDKIISDVLKKQAELYFYDESNIFCDNKELVINVLDEIWQDKTLYNTIKKLLYRKLFISIMENEK